MGFKSCKSYSPAFYMGPQVFRSESLDRFRNLVILFRFLKYLLYIERDDLDPNSKLKVLKMMLDSVLGPRVKDISLFG